jgi:hypothetical protein
MASVTLNAQEIARCEDKARKLRMKIDAVEEQWASFIREQMLPEQVWDPKSDEVLE